MSSSKTLPPKSICFYDFAYSVFTHRYTCVHTSSFSEIYFGQYKFSYKVSLRGTFLHVSATLRCFCKYSKIGWVGVKFFVYFSFNLYTYSFNDGNMRWFWIHCICKIWFSILWQNLGWALKFKCAQNHYTTVNLLYIKFSASVKKS